MTCIAWDGTTLAADKQSTFAGLPRTTTKIHRAKDGSLMGATGTTAVCVALRNWYDAGAIAADFPDKDKDSSLLVVKPDGTTLLFGSNATPIHIEDAFYAMGSGRDFATAAMHLGKTAREAVEVACKFDVYCGRGVDELDLHEPTPAEKAQTIFYEGALG